MYVLTMQLCIDFYSHKIQWHWDLQ